MPMWFTVRDGEIWVWTYAKSQKVKNLERDPQATLLVETGDEYTELRGVMIEAEAEIHRDPDVVFEFGKELTVRYSEGIDSIEGDAAEALEAQAAKRVAIRFVARAHRDLGPPQARRHLLARARPGPTIAAATSRPRRRGTTRPRASGTRTSDRRSSKNAWGRRAPGRHVAPDHEQHRDPVAQIADRQADGDHDQPHEDVSRGTWRSGEEPRRRALDQSGRWS